MMDSFRKRKSVDVPFISQPRRNHSLHSSKRKHRDRHCVPHTLYFCRNRSRYLCIICTILIAVVAVLLFLYHGHRITCYVSIQLCTPFHVYVRMLHSHILVNPAMDSTQFERTLQSMHNREDDDDDVCVGKRVHHPCAQHLQLGILLAQRHGGSTWAIEELNRHPSIGAFRERLEDWENNECAWFAKVERAFFSGVTLAFDDDGDDDACTHVSLIAALHRVYDALFAQLQRDHTICAAAAAEEEGDSPVQYSFLFWKVQIEQLHASMFSSFVDFLHCNNVTVIHLVRQASIEAFVSYQMETVERVSTLEFEKIFRHKQLNHASDFLMRQEAIEIDPVIAGTFVHNIDANIEYLGKLIQWSAHPIAYLKLFYEDLIGPHSQRYWRAMFSFIGVSYRPRKHGNDKSKGLQKKHSTPCYRKISNWQRVKPYLRNTSSYWLCDRMTAA